MKKLETQYSIDTYDCAYKINDLIDLVKSQQEAIEKLAERLELTERRARYACLHALKRENEELADDKLDIDQIHKDLSSAGKDLFADDKPYGYDNLKHDTDLAKEAIADDKLKYEYGNSVTKVKLDPTPTTQDSDTHRTVTLRIPKDMTVGEAIIEAYDESVEAHIYDWLAMTPDTDLQAEIDKIGDDDE